jgi:drug/metabolite transporter (DMT)-like permease
VLLLEPVLAAAVAWFLFGEFLKPLNILSFILITAGIYLAKTGKVLMVGTKIILPPKCRKS